MPPPLFTDISDRGENEGTDFNKINILPEHLLTIGLSFRLRFTDSDLQTLIT